MSKDDEGCPRLASGIALSRRPVRHSGTPSRGDSSPPRGGQESLREGFNRVRGTVLVLHRTNGFMGLKSRADGPYCLAR